MPEMGAPAVRTYDNCRRWVKEGHKVQVLTGFPNHPVGKLYPGYKMSLWQREEIDGIDILRVFTYLTPNKGKFRRCIQYIMFWITAIIGSFGCEKPDVIIGTSPQFLVAFAAWIISVFKRVPFVFEVRDLWPDSILAVGALKNPLIIGTLRMIERLLYNRAAKIVVVTHSFKERLLEMGVPEGKIEVVTNSVDVKLFVPQEACPILKKKHNLEDKFLVSYIGTHGMAHDLDTVLNTAHELRHNEKLHFIFVGEGAEKQRLKKKRTEMRLNNVTFIDRQTREEMPAWIATTDLHLVHLKANSLFKTVIPSKIFEIMGMGKPMVIAVDGEARKIVEDSGSGTFSQPGDAKELAKTITQMAADPDKMLEMGKRGRDSAMNTYNRDLLAGKYIDILSDVSGLERQMERQSQVSVKSV
jgi:glycosyltransferase involved in cell wall biosynthesis